MAAIVSGVEDPATLDGFLSAQIGTPLHPKVSSALERRRVNITTAPLDPVVGLLGTLAEIDRARAIAWVDEVGEYALVARLPQEVPWATQVLFEDGPNGRVVRCDYHHIEMHGEDDINGNVVRICEIALALSPRSDVAASAALAPNGELAGFADYDLAEKRIPRENLPTASLPAWNRRWRDAIAIRVATPTYSEYLSRAADMIERLVPALDRVIDLILRSKNVGDTQLSTLGSIYEAACTLTPPAIAAAEAAGTGSSEFNRNRCGEPTFRSDAGL